VKCSLLSLSTYIDGELAADRKAELDAHLVGCARCSSGAATLREEKTRLGQLARVRVAPQSARLMLEQVGITGVLDLPGVARQAAPSATPAIDQPPWQAAQEKARQNSAALPWTPRRPAPGSQAMDAVPASSAPPEFQPDLPFVGSPAEERLRTSEPVQQPDDQRPAEIAAAATHVDVPPEPPAEVIAHDYPWFEADVPSRGWDMSPGDDAPHREENATPDAAPVPPPPMPMPVPVAAVVPTRVPSTGRSMLLSRIRDAIAVRLTLARHADAIEESAQIVSGAAPPRGRQLPARAEPMAAIATDATDVELTGIPDAVRAAPVRPPAETPVAKAPVTKAPDTVPPATPPATEDAPREATPAEPVAWNAFGASSYPRSEADAAPAAPAPARRVSLGRHSRAVAREQVGVAVRMRRALAATGALLGQGGDAATAGGRAIVTTVRGANPDRRIIAAIAAVAIIFITVLVVGHRATPATSPTARALPATTAPAHAPTSAATAAPPSARAPATAAPKTAVAPPQTVQTFGAGGTGFQVRDLRYGQQSGYLRMVFDMGPVSGSTGSSPKITVAFTNPTTMLVTFDGTVPAGSTGNPPAHGVISSVTLVSSSGGKSVYRIVVTRPVTARALFLSGTSPPLRFVLDLH
jgi:hypothetical protein